MVASFQKATSGFILLAALLILAGGGWLSRREDKIEIGENRKKFQEFAADFQTELLRLERLYEFHMRDIANVSDWGDNEKTRRLCDRILGVSRVETVSASMKSETLFSASANFLSGSSSQYLDAAWIRAAIFPPEGPTGILRENWGWLEAPGKEGMVYWFRGAKDMALLVLVDRRSVVKAIDTSLKEWVRLQLRTFRREGGLLEVFDPDGLSLLGTEKHVAEPADVIFPFRTRFGSWQMSCWDPQETRISYNIPTLGAAIIVAFFLVMCGGIVFVQQQRAFELTMQRVSFVNRVSHELRTPLTNIQLNLDLAVEQSDAGLARSRLAIVQTEVWRLTKMIDNVLTFSRPEKGKLRVVERTAVPMEVVQSVVDQFSASFTKRGLAVQLTGNALSVCRFDSALLSQILTNLLSNVEKYAGTGFVRISIFFDHGELTVVVSDEGLGISSADAEKIFRPFERVKNTLTERASGVGLGLAISRDLAVQMGGTLRLVSTPRGASFELKVPAAAAGSPIQA